MKFCWEPADVFGGRIVIHADGSDRSIIAVQTDPTAFFLCRLSDGTVAGFPVNADPQGMNEPRQRRADREAADALTIGGWIPAEFYNIPPMKLT